MVEQSQQNIARDRHLFGDHPKRILSLDGGGVRGLITLGMLKRVESLLKSRSTAGAHFRLCQYFDLIGGTSTGAIIATMLAMGLTVDRIIALYFDMIPKIFGAPRPVGGLIYPKFDPETFDRIIQQVFDEILRDDLERPDLVDRPDRLTHPRLDSNVLQTGLAIFAKRADTNSVWPVTNNPRSKYWTPDGPFWQNRPPEQREDFFPNRDYSLRQIVRASASAPYYLDAIEIDVGPGQTGFFLDGGVSPHNNPAGELFLMTTLRNMEGQVRSPTGFEWPAGADNIFLLSLGTGQWRRRAEPEQYRALHSAQRSFEALAGMITDSEKHALTWLQALSEPADAFHIDANYANLQGMLIPEEPLLTFQRINPVLEEQWLSDNLGNSYWRDRASIEAMREIDQTALDNLNRLYEVGLQTGWRKITPSLFQTEFDGTAIDGHQQPAAAAKALQV